MLLKRLWAYLFDFSAADQNREEVEIILRAALRESRTDAEFDAQLRETLLGWEGRDKPAKYRYIFFLHFLEENRRREDRHGIGIRTVALHVLEDLPRIFGQSPEKSDRKQPRKLRTNNER